MYRLVIAGLLLLWIDKGQAQVVTTDPPLPVVSESVTLFFDATQGTGGLKNYEGDVYAHIGVLTSESSSSTDWKYVKTNWGQNTPETKLTRVSDNLYEMSLEPSIREYFGVPEGISITDIALVFRSGQQVGGSYLEGKDTGGKDIFVEVFEEGLNLSITQPASTSISELNTDVNLTVVVNKEADLSLYLNGDIVTSTTASGLNYTFNFTESGDNWIWVTAESGEESASDSIYLHVLDSQPTGSLDPGLIEGINYRSDTEVSLVLYAPFKEHIFVIGEFNDWLPSSAYRMKKDGDHFFLTLSGLTPGKEYAFQYLVDDEITIADPYTHKVLDPWNDKWISDDTYPNLKPYPEGKAEGIVSLLQTAQEEYQWQYEFDPHPNEDLVIYELLVRDFIATHDWKTLTDTLDYFTELGINAIELMPFNEFEGNESWGYNPSFYFAVDKYYGPANDLKAFIDSCHNRGIAVIMDMVLNHSFGQSPFVRLYSNEFGHPTKKNPWYNADAVDDPNDWYQAIHPYNVGFDFDHSSTQTQKLVDRINRFWIEEFRIDGYRFDLTKGFTQKNTIQSVDAQGNVTYDEAETSRYDPQRIGFLKRMADEIWKVNPAAYLILEHFTENSEEEELANYGMMVWGNGNHSYSEASMGYLPGSDFGWISHSTRGWSVPHVIGYMESHDEERLMYRNLEFGNSYGNYDIQDLSTALFRVEMAAAFFFTIPGPKMIWQFGELGYDFSINYNGRLGNKPRRWYYYHTRHRLFEIFSTLIKLKQNEPVFRTDDISLNLAGGFKSIALNHEDMDLRVIGNFNVTTMSGSADFSQTGTWYDFLSGESMEVNDVSMEIELAPGEYRIYTSKALETPSLPTTADPERVSNSKLYPNPAVDYIVVESEMQTGRIILRDVSGRIIRDTESQGRKTTLGLSGLMPGLYVIELGNEEAKEYHRFIKK